MSVQSIQLQGAKGSSSAIQQYVHNLLDTEDVPPIKVNEPVDTLVYLQRTGRAFPSGEDPHWDYATNFQGYIRAPMDAQAVALHSIVVNTNPFEYNPDAGRNGVISLLANDGVGIDLSNADASEEYLTKVFRKPMSNDPLGNEYLAKQMIASKSDTSQDKKEEIYEVVNAEGQIRGTGNYRTASGKDVSSNADFNLLRSQGYDLVNDTRGEHPLFTDRGEPIPYYSDNSLYEAKPDDDPIDSELPSLAMKTKYYIDWFGYELGPNRKNTPNLKDTDLDTQLRIGNPYLEVMSGASYLAQNRAMNVEAQVFVSDEQHVQDNLRMMIQDVEAHGENRDYAIEQFDKQFL